jgi:hypothetical protein
LTYVKKKIWALLRGFSHFFILKYEIRNTKTEITNIFSILISGSQSLSKNATILKITPSYWPGLYFLAYYAFVVSFWPGPYGFFLARPS